MNSFTVFDQVLILLFIVMVGFYTKKVSIINDEVSRKLSEFLLKISNPVLVISSFQFKFTQEMLHNVFIIFIFSMVIHAFSAILGKVLYHRYPDSEKKILKFVTIYSNCGYMGFPVLGSLYGQVGVLYASVYVAAFNIFVWTNGVMIFSGKKDIQTIKKAFLNPGIISVVIGMLIFVFSVKLPYPVSKTLDMLGAMTVPLSMLIVGAVLANTDFRKMFSGFTLYYVTFVRLIFIPLVVLLALKLIGLSGVVLGTCVILVAMPAAAATTIFSEMYNGDSPFAARIVAFSTIVSLITIPLITMLLK